MATDAAKQAVSNRLTDLQKHGVERMSDPLPGKVGGGPPALVDRAAALEQLRGFLLAEAAGRG